MINAADFYEKRDMKVLDGLTGYDFEVTSPDEELDGAAMLVSMAKSGKIDPWNIDIVDVTEKCLMQVAQSKSADLRITGRTILFLSILCKIKSNYLVGEEPGDYESVNAANHYDDFEENNEDFDYDPVPVKKTNVVSLDEALKRRTSIRLNRSRTVTLNDLIRQLKFYEELDRKQAFKRQLERAKQRRSSFRRMSVKQIVNLANEEFINKSITKIKEKLEKLFVKNEKVELNELVDAGIDKVSAYLALLFLSVRGEAELTQKEFYGNLYVERAVNG